MADEFKTKDEKYYKLSPGQKLFDSEGNIIAEKALKGKMSQKEKEIILESLKKLKKKKKKKKDIDRTEEYMDFKSGKKDEGYSVMEAAKGGMVKKYKHGGSVSKNTMATTKGWGISRKT